jgi:hypothetical protein
MCSLQQHTKGSAFSTDFFDEGKAISFDVAETYTLTIYMYKRARES